MTSSQQHPPQPPKYYTYGYPSTPRLNVMGVYAIPGSASSPPDNASQNVPGAFQAATSTPHNPMPGYQPASVPADAEPVSPSSYAYQQQHFALGRSPPSLSPLESPLSTPPRYYYGQFGPLIPQAPEAAPARLYASQPPQQPPSSQLAAVGAAPGGPNSPYYARQSRRMRRKSHEEVAYAMNFPSHPVPEHMFIATGPPNANWTALPPKPEEVRVRRYATGVDERNFFTVLEYKINEQPIIWDYYTGYVHLTGIWKAIGHAKADIVKLLDNSPELEPIIKRVRGGFLKIQGTWVPFSVAHRLAKHICYYVRYALVPMFGPEFPDECTKPDEPGFGELHLNQPYSQLLHVQHRVKQGAPAAIAPASAPVSAPTGSSSQPHSLHRLPSVHAHHATSTAPVYPQGPLVASGRHARHHSEGHTSRDVAREALKDAGRRRRESVGSRPRASSGSHQRSESFNSIRRAIEKHHVKVDTSPETGSQNLIIDAVDEEVYDENVFEDEEPVGSISPPPMPRKLSFRDEQRVSESPSEFLEMLKATRSLQQMSAGRRSSEHWNRTGGGFECAGRQFRWDGSDRLEVILDSPHQSPADLRQKPMPHQDSGAPHVAAHDKKREYTPPSHSEKRVPSLARILNID